MLHEYVLTDQPATALVWWRPLVSVGGIDVVHVDLSVGAEFDQAAFAWLDAAERARWNRFRAEHARRHYARCRAALRAMLCERLDCSNEALAFGAGGHGKPFATVAGKALPASFNVSHCPDHGLIAFGPDGTPLGVDVESRDHRGNLRLVAEGVFGSDELAVLARHSDAEWRRLFFRLWTLKEAVIKALGTGFALSPKNFEMPSALLHGAKSAPFHFLHAPEEPWFVHGLGEERFAAALAAGGEHAKAMIRL